MNDISAVQSDANATLRELTARSEENDPKDDKTLFLELMIAQMENQDPLNPQEGGEFLAQLAQFSTVEGIEKLNNQFDTLAGQLRSSQALSATALVGRKVGVQTAFGSLGEQGLSGTVSLPQSTTNVRIDIFSPTGQLVQQLPLGSASAGDVPFFWNGYDNAGNRLPTGEYQVKAFATIDGEQEQVGTRMGANVNSVTINKDGSLTLNVAGVGPVDFNEITELQ